jgi:prevent-host-death family protein
VHVTLRAAKAHLSKLIEAARSGEEIVIARADKSIAKLVAIPQRGFKIGLLKERLKGSAPDFLKPMSEDELALWEGDRRGRSC